jgi:hypothetical protein
VITDYGFEDPAKVRYSLSIFAVVISALAILTLLWGLNAYRDRAKAMLAQTTGSAAE